MTEEQLDALIEKFLLDAGEHCTSVRVFLSRQTEDGNALTSGITNGCGSLYAQIGQVSEWLEMQKEYAKIKARENSESED